MTVCMHKRMYAWMTVYGINVCMDVCMRVAYAYMYMYPGWGDYCIRPVGWGDYCTIREGIS